MDTTDPERRTPGSEEGVGVEVAARAAAAAASKCKPDSEGIFHANVGSLNSSSSSLICSEFDARCC